MNKELLDQVTAETRLIDYYARRAPEYERIYHRPERQQELRKLEQLVAQAFCGRDVLEIACGTGYWTQFIAKQAKSILATDCSREVIDIARDKDYALCPVSFVESDAYSLKNIEGTHSAGFSGFWWSHITKAKLPIFINSLHSKLDNHALVALIDNRYVEGNSLPVSRRDADGNTYQMRRLADGSEHEVLKNFPTKAELTEQLTPYAHDLEIEFLTYYWFARYRVASGE